MLSRYELLSLPVYEILSSHKYELLHHTLKHAHDSLITQPMARIIASPHDAYLMHVYHLVYIACLKWVGKYAAMTLSLEFTAEDILTFGYLELKYMYDLDSLAVRVCKMLNIFNSLKKLPLFGLVTQIFSESFSVFISYTFIWLLFFCIPKVSTRFNPKIYRHIRLMGIIKVIAYMTIYLHLLYPFVKIRQELMQTAIWEPWVHNIKNWVRVYKALATNP